MNRLKAAALVLTATAACSEREASGDRSAQAARTADTDVAAQAQPVPPPLAASGFSGGGSTLTGSVSGLTGEITAFQVEVTDTSTIVQLAADVLFEFDSAKLGGGAPEQLRRTADLIRQGGPGEISVVGHTDSKGTDTYNDDLSLRRAQAVAQWLSAEGGVSSARLRPSGRGEQEPIAANATPDGRDDPAGRARNRRVVVVIPRAAG